MSESYELLHTLVQHPDENVRLMVASRPQLTRDLFDILVKDPSSIVRAKVASRVQEFPSSVATLFADDPDDAVRIEVSKGLSSSISNLSVEKVLAIFHAYSDDRNPEVLSNLFANMNVTLCAHIPDSLFVKVMRQHGLKPLHMVLFVIRNERGRLRRGFSIALINAIYDALASLPPLPVELANSMNFYDVYDTLNRTNDDWRHVFMAYKTLFRFNYELFDVNLRRHIFATVAASPFACFRVGAFRFLAQSDRELGARLAFDPHKEVRMAAASFVETEDEQVRLHGLKDPHIDVGLSRNSRLSFTVAKAILEGDNIQAISWLSNNYDVIRNNLPAFVNMRHVAKQKRSSFWVKFLQCAPFDLLEYLPEDMVSDFSELELRYYATRGYVPVHHVAALLKRVHALWVSPNREFPIDMVLSALAKTRCSDANLFATLWEIGNIDVKYEILRNDTFKVTPEIFTDILNMPDTEHFLTCFKCVGIYTTLSAPRDMCLRLLELVQSGNSMARDVLKTCLSLHSYAVQNIYYELSQLDDREILEALALKATDMHTLCTLATSKYAEVRVNLATRAAFSLPKEILKILAKDPCQMVRAQALRYIR